MTSRVEAILTDAHDPGDEWGSVMGAWFALADALSLRDEPIPDAWEFRPALTTQTETERREDSYVLEMVLSAYDAGDVTGDEIRVSGDALMVVSDELRAAGKDY